MNQERGSSRWHEGSNQSRIQNESEWQMLAGRGLPASAVLIDVRPQSTYDYPLLWNLATEIEDLATQMRLKRIPHWEYLEECIDFLQVSTQDRSLATSYITLTSRTDKRTFESDREFASYVSAMSINRVRGNRQSASVRQEKGAGGSFRLSVGPIQSMVRVFFLIDMGDEDTFDQAIRYAALLKQFNYEYDEPERSGHEERLNLFAICMNADPKQRDVIFQSYPAFETVFDDMVLIQAYRDDDTFIGDDMQAYEVEQIMYALLLASPGEITSERDVVLDEDLAHYLEYIEKPSSASTCSIYMIGVSSTEYSARWGQRWLSYGLVAKLIELMGDKQEVEYGDALLQLAVEKNSDVKQNAFDNWWRRAQNILPGSLSVLLPQILAISTTLASTALLQFPSSLTETMPHLEMLRSQTDEWFKDANQQTLKEALEAITYLPALIKNKARERNKRSREMLTREDKAILDMVVLQEEAQALLVRLFGGAKGAFPRALLQLDALNTQFKQLHKESQQVPDFKRYKEQFKDEIETTTREMKKSFQTWRLSLFGTVLRSNALTWLTALGVALVLVLAAILFLAAPWRFFTMPIFSRFGVPVSTLALCLLLVILVLLGTTMITSRRRKRLRAQRESALQNLYGLAQMQQAELQALIVKRAALQLLAMSGLYDPDGSICPYDRRLRELDRVLKEAHEQALNERQSAYERLRLSLSATQVGLPQQTAWLNLNTRRDWLPWPRLSEAFQQIYQHFDEGDIYFDELVKRMIQQAAPQSLLSEPAPEVQFTSRAARVDDRKELQFLASELVAMIISAKVNGYNLVKAEPQIKRYIALLARSLQRPSLLAESIITLEQAVKDLQLEQVIQGTESSYLNEISDSFFLKRNRTIEQILAAWVNHYLDLKEDIQTMLQQRAITAHLQDEHISPDDAIADLQTRFQLFGYHDFTHGGGNDHFYLLLVPGVASEDFFSSLDKIQLPQFQWVSFPDEEKLIYMHVHRTRLQKQNLLMIK